MEKPAFRGELLAITEDGVERMQRLPRSFEMIEA
jgi:hypothetical protein